MPIDEPPDLRDTYTKAGATRLADTIRAHWAARGHSVAVEAYEIGDRKWGVRSNLSAGLPRQEGRGSALRASSKRKLCPRIQEAAE